MALPDRDRSGAVLIGTSDYPGDPANIPDIPAVRNNLARLNAILTDRRYWGLTTDACTVQLNPNDIGSTATALASMAERVEDTLFVYLTGHGFVAPNGELVVGLTSTRSDLVQYTGLRYSWIREIIANTNARRTVLIVDCCFSGRAITAMSGTDSLLAGQMDIDGAYILTATAANTTAVAPRGAEYTAFTSSIVEILSTGIASAAPYVRLRDIYDYTRRSMIRTSRPQPLQLGTNRIGELPLVRNVGQLQCPEDALATHQSTAHLEPARSSRILEGRDCTLAVSVVNFAFLSALDQVDAQLELLEMLDRAAASAGMDSTEWIRRPHRAGETILIHMAGPGEDRGNPIDTVRNLTRQVSARNHSTRHKPALRLAVGLHVFPSPGEVGGAEIRTNLAFADLLLKVALESIHSLGLAEDVIGVVSSNVLKYQLLNSDVRHLDARSVTFVVPKALAPAYLWLPPAT